MSQTINDLLKLFIEREITENLIIKYYVNDRPYEYETVQINIVLNELYLLAQFSLYIQLFNENC